MSDGKKVKTEGGGGKRGGGRMIDFRNNNQPNNTTYSQTRKLEDIETNNYIRRHFSLANWYEKVTKEIIINVIRNLPSGVYLARVMRDVKIRNMLLDTNTKQYKKPDRTSAVENEEYEFQILDWKDNTHIKNERKRKMNEGN